MFLLGPTAGLYTSIGRGAAACVLVKVKLTMPSELLEMDDPALPERGKLRSRTEFPRWRLLPVDVSAVPVGNILDEAGGPCIHAALIIGLVKTAGST